MIAAIKKLVDSRGFSWFILVMIILAAVLVGIETYPGFDDATPAGHLVNGLQDVVLWVFAVEAVLKILSHGSKPWRYFLDPWNLFDFAVVVVCFLPQETQFAAVFRLARLLRALRLVTALPRLQLLVGALLKSIPSLGYVGALLALHFYTYAVMGTFLFRKNDPIHFGNLHNSMLTLFEVVTLEGWVDTMRIQMNGSDFYGYDEQMLQIAGPGRESSASPIISPIYFVSFIMLGTMIILNLFTGVIIEGMKEAQDDAAKLLAEEHEEEFGHTTISDQVEEVENELQVLAQKLRVIKERAHEARYLQDARGEPESRAIV